MANFKSIDEAIISAHLEFIAIGDNTIQQFACKNGEIAGFRIIKLPTSSGDFEVSQIYDYSSGSPVQVGNVSAVAGLDLTGGYFSSGCFCDSDPLSAGANFYKVDY